ncbi:MAG: prepilin-type N-terminal cleavage/methylation domain-containing protein [Candidatus Thiodiazotropha taylori]
MCCPACATERPAVGFTSRGFTLVELLIALVLMSLIMVLLFSGLDLGRRSWHSAAEATTRQSDQRLAFDYLKQSFGGMFNERFDTDDGPLPLFYGDQKLIRWVAPTASQAGLGGASLFRLELLGEGDDKLLLLKRWLFHPEVLQQEPEAGRDWRAALTEAWQPADQDVDPIRYSEHPLLPELSDLQLSYYGSLQRGVPDEWHSEWQESEKLPQMIRLILHGKQQNYPPLTVMIRGAQR